MTSTALLGRRNDSAASDPNDQLLEQALYRWWRRRLQTIADEAFATFVASPMIDAEDRARTLEKLFRGRASDLLVDSLQIIQRKDRLALLPTIAEAFRQQHQREQGRVDVRIKTATALSDRLREDLRRAITERYGRQPEFFEQVDESLIGGMVLQVDDEKVDSSVVRQIEKLRRTMHDRAAKEIHRSRKQKAGQGAISP